MKNIWFEKRDNCRDYQIKTLNKSIADMTSGSLMLIPSTNIINKFVKKIPYGTFVNFQSLRIELANQFKCDVTCPLTSGIFLRIVSEVAYEEYISGVNLDSITPFWRTVDSKSNLANKLECGVGFITEQQLKEQIQLN